ncbi:MAG: DDE-type integrase/transposase/recombinase [Burkholderiales bacterium]|nr:DDE-type integrase/transposase/recombinase [Burkholderiales bacterium]
MRNDSQPALNPVQFVTVSEAAELEGVTERTIKNRCANKEHKQRYCGAEEVIINGVATWRIPVTSISNEAHYQFIKKQKDVGEGRQFPSEMPGETADLSEKRSAIIAMPEISTADHAKTVASIDDSEFNDANDCRPMVGKRSAISGVFLTVTQVSELEDKSLRTIRDRCNNGFYKGVKKESLNGGEGWLIPLTSLSKSAQKAYAKKFTQEITERTGVKPAVPAVRTDRHAEYQQMLDIYDRKTANFKRRAEQALTELRAYHDYMGSGMSIGEAAQALKQSHGVSRSTIRRYLDKTKLYPEFCWLPALCDQHKGGRARAEFTPDAYSYILAAKIKAPQAKLRVILREAQKIGANLEWVIPNEDTVAKRIKEEPAHLFLSEKELERSYPVIEREFSMLVNEMWETDGRKADVWCIWPDGTEGRPYVIAYRDVRSRYVLSLRICHAPDTEAAAGAFGTACKNAQAIPQHMKVDNGREYDNHVLTAGQSNRYRRNFRADVADGLWKEMGITARFSKPANGRDKPIESFWNVVSENVDRLPVFAGAYCGHNVLSKPEDFDQRKAVPVELYANLLKQAIAEYHQRPHRGKGMNLRTPNEVFNDPAIQSETRKPTASELRKCRMGKTQLRLDKKEASFRFKMKGFDAEMKYSAPELLELPTSQRHGKFDVYYDYGQPNEPVSVWQNGGFICDAIPKGRIDFIEAGAKQTVAHMEGKNKYIASVKRLKKEIAKAGASALSAFYSAPTLGAAEAQTESLIAPSSKPKAVSVLASPIQADPERPGESINTETGERYIGFAAEQEQERQARLKAVADEAKYLADLKKKQEEKLRSSAY